MHRHTHKLSRICNRVVLAEPRHQQAVPHFLFYPCCLKIRTQTTWTHICVCVCVCVCVWPPASDYSCCVQTATAARYSLQDRKYSTVIWGLGRAVWPRLQRWLTVTVEKRVKGGTKRLTSMRWEWPGVTCRILSGAGMVDSENYDIEKNGTFATLSLSFLSLHTFSCFCSNCMFAQRYIVVCADFLCAQETAALRNFVQQPW